MSYDEHLTTLPSPDYELLDSGDNMKLERFGDVITARPETQALWEKLRPELWKTAHAEFSSPKGGEHKGTWKKRAPIPESWEMSWEDVRFTARLTGFKHVGVFPEQSPNWAWVAERVQNLENPRVLNLFGYTGIASLVAAKAGASVTHVDASKQSLTFAHENARLSGIGEDRIRWIPDDALTFAKRDARRGASYDGIIADPPAFGRGGKGEVWHIEEDLPKLLRVLSSLLKKAPGSFFLLNGYAAGYAPRSFAQAVENEFNVPVQAGELHIKEAAAGRVIPSGIYVRFVR